MGQVMLLDGIFQRGGWVIFLIAFLIGGIQAALNQGHILFILEVTQSPNHQKSAKTNCYRHSNHGSIHFF
jgi:hypothetical protein